LAPHPISGNAVMKITLYDSDSFHPEDEDSDRED